MHRQKCVNFNDGLCTLVQTVVEKTPNETLIISVSGGSCSGKSYFCNHLSRRLDALGIKHTMLELDSYFRDLDDPLLPTGSKGEPLYDTPDSYHREEFREHLEVLVKGSSVVCPHYDLAKNKRSQTTFERKEPSGVILVDGLFAISQTADITGKKALLYVDATAALRLQRRIARDTTRFNVPSGVIERVFWERIEPAHQGFIEPQKGFADLIVR